MGKKQQAKIARLETQLAQMAKRLRAVERKTGLATPSALDWADGLNPRRTPLLTTISWGAAPRRPDPLRQDGAAAITAEKRGHERRLMERTRVDPDGTVRDRETGVVWGVLDPDLHADFIAGQQPKQAITGEYEPPSLLTLSDAAAAELTTTVANALDSDPR